MSDSLEQLFTPQELATITAAAEDPLLKHPTQIHIMGMEPVSIQRLSPAGLILTAGTEHTGLLHIRLRHRAESLHATWQEIDTPAGERRVRLDDPGRFRPGLVPILDYSTIADVVYQHGALDTLGNKRPETFERYVGPFTYPDGKSEAHVLLLYKETKVIHTLHPVKKTHNRKRAEGLLYKRGFAGSRWDVLAGQIETTIPYMDKEGRLRFAILIRLKAQPKVWELLALGYNEAGEIDRLTASFIIHYEGEASFHPMDEISKWQYADLRPLERLIRDADEG